MVQVQLAVGKSVDAAGARDGVRECSQLLATVMIVKTMLTMTGYEFDRTMKMMWMIEKKKRRRREKGDI